MMPTYAFVCYDCDRRHEEFLWPSEYDTAPFPLCESCGEKMVRSYDKSQGITFRSKGIFPYYDQHLETPGMDSGPVRVDSYQDLKKKLKERGLQMMEAPSPANAHIMKGKRWV